MDLQNAAAALLGSLATLLLAGATALKWRRSSRRLDQAEDRRYRRAAIDDLTAALEENTAIRKRLRAVEDSEKLCREGMERMEGDRDRLQLRIARLEAALPAALLTARLEDLDPSVLEVLDGLSNPVTLSVPAEDGRLAWVNAAFAAALGRPREEILELGWQRLVHPADSLRTGEAEAEAWGRPVRVTNRYRHADGRWIVLRWWASSYDRGVAVARVQVMGAEAGPAMLGSAPDPSPEAS